MTFDDQDRLLTEGDRDTLLNENIGEDEHRFAPVLAPRTNSDMKRLAGKNWKSFMTKFYDYDEKQFSYLQESIEYL